MIRTKGTGRLVEESLFETGREKQNMAVHWNQNAATSLMVFLKFLLACNDCSWTCRECRKPIFKGEPVVSRDGRKVICAVMTMPVL
jgi:hypothetical protein